MYRQVDNIRRGIRRQIYNEQSIQNGEGGSSRGHLAVSLLVESNAGLGMWTILDMAGCERPVALAKEEIYPDFDKKLTWNKFFQSHRKSQQQLVDNKMFKENISDVAETIAQGYFINESNNHFMAYLRSNDTATGTVNPQYGPLDIGMRVYQADKLSIKRGGDKPKDRKYRTNGVTTLLNKAGTKSQFIYRLGELEDDRKYVLRTMFVVRKEHNKQFDDAQNPPMRLTPESVGDEPFHLEEIYVKKEKLDEVKKWRRYVLKAGRDSNGNVIIPKTELWKKITIQHRLMVIMVVVLSC